MKWSYPDVKGKFGPYGGRFVPETLVPALEQLEREFRAAWTDDAFRSEYAGLLGSYAGRPTSAGASPSGSACASCSSART